MVPLLPRLYLKGKSYVSHCPRRRPRESAPYYASGHSPIGCVLGRCGSPTLSGFVPILLQGISPTYLGILSHVEPRPLRRCARRTRFDCQSVSLEPWQIWRILQRKVRSDGKPLGGATAFIGNGRQSYVFSSAIRGDESCSSGNRRKAGGLQMVECESPVWAGLRYIAGSVMASTWNNRRLGILAH